MHSFRLGCAVAGLILGIVTMRAVAPVWAGGSLPIINAGFENPLLAEGAWQSAVPCWTHGMYDVSAPTVWIVS